MSGVRRQRWFEARRGSGKDVLMSIRVRHIWEVLTGSYWFVPMVMVLAAAVGAFVLLYLDGTGATSDMAWFYSGGSEGAKTLLSTVAGSVITVAGVVFSITIAALTQASSQFGPRLLRNFMRDTGNQIVLGTFVATFVYSLLVLRTIHGELDGVRFVPHASVTVAVLFAVASITVLIYFIHHVSVSLQAPAVVANVRADLDEVIARLPDDHKGSSDRDNELPADFETASRPVVSTKQGYVQALDYDGLLEAAKKADLILRLKYKPGDYVIEGNPLLVAWPADRCDDDLIERANSAFICGHDGTAEQDVEHAIRQLVEIAVRALSPGINDPFTAINCIDALGSAVCRVGLKGLPGPHRCDDQGRLRLIMPVTTFAGITDTAFNQIRQFGQGNVPVTIRLLEIIAELAGQLTNAEHRQALLRHATMVYEDSRETIPQPRDRNDVRERWEATVRLLGPPVVG